MIRIHKLIPLIVSLFIILLGVMTQAHAAMFSASGWYIEAGAGESKLENKSYGAGNSASGQGFGWNGVAGYKFLPFFAMEAGYTKYADVTVKNSGVQVSKDHLYSYDLAARGILPVSNTGANLFIKLGAARLNSHLTGSNQTTSTATGVYFGGGADYAFMPNFGVNAEWNRAKGNNSTGNMDLYSLGLTYLIE